MRGTTTLSIAEFNAAAKIIEDATDILGTLEDVPLTVDEVRMLGKIELQLAELAIAMSKRLDSAA